MKDTGSSPLFAGWGKKTSLYLPAAVITGLLLVLLCICFWFDSRRTLKKALEGMGTGEKPLTFSEESGFFEDGFMLRITPAERVPQDGTIQIRYTLNGDEPTADSPLYGDGIDLEEACRASRAEEARRELAKKEAIAAADAEAARLAAQAEQAAAEAADGNAGTEEETGEDNAKDAADQETQEKDTQSQNAEKIPSLEEGRASWQTEKWTAASDFGVRPERTDDGICVIPVRACLMQGEDRSPVVTCTYVIGPGVRERYQNTLVASVVTDSYNLFDYNYGVMVKGSHYQSDVEDGVREDRAGNFFQKGDEWSKNGHVTLFSQDGSVLLEEDAALEISGYSSRNLPTRSFRARASKDFGSSDDYFTLDIFSSGLDPDLSQTAGIDRFRKVKFRSHGIPTYHIRCVRNEYAKRLTDACGFPGLSDNRPGVMFLNGEFYTTCDVTPSADRDYLCSLFNLKVPDALEKYSGSDVDVYTKAKILKLFTADLTDPANQAALERTVDMDNYLFYYALEVLFNNVDWPYNNMTIWRYLGEEDPDNPYTDGRIRYVLDDMDQILSNNLHGDPARWSTELIDYLMKDKGSTFYHVMQCKRYRDTFLTYVDDLLRTSFAPDDACAVLDDLYAGLKREYILDYGEAFWKEMEDTAEVTKQNVREKETLYRANITEFMGLTERYAVQIETDEGIEVTWNNDCGMSPSKRIQKIGPGETWSGEYYAGTSFTAEAVPADGYRFAGWEVKGIYSEQDAADDQSDQAERGGTAATGTENNQDLSITISDRLPDPDRKAATVIVRAISEPASE